MIEHDLAYALPCPLPEFTPAIEAGYCVLETELLQLFDRGRKRIDEPSPVARASAERGERRNKDTRRFSRDLEVGAAFGWVNQRAGGWECV